mmetsp:Transcript_20182/g.43575  ORF Transcript_20182/g.43575 Transcript_20182/m.43575 type:complete len:334 (-) Transcript_20182:92-1093(-)|eukprot:CAMPEP_0168740210 /NCGR_PEP_ID=MMETSP0724-20121128/11859_1 /TAXON_ID=265536 /ORGANISM="Amphiprora sp., Strain CCMP467" /LENGTH=333 /DNA_ID=CAMNT_0008787633 /DNA_START=176 /DNA_END=1177 /DNA_ORIENTATION=-
MSSDTKTSAALEHYQDIPALKKLCDFLRGRQGPKVREGVCRGQRVQYIKGEKMVDFLFEPKKGTKWPDKLPRFENRQEVVAICKLLTKEQFIVQAEKVGKSELELLSARTFQETGFYVWVYEGDKTKMYLMTGGLIVSALLMALQPVWPMYIRVFVWYLAVSFLLFIFGLILVRALLFLFVWIAGYEFWFLPNLFDETLGFYESFVPVFSFERTKSGQLWIRLSVAVAFFSFCYWAVTQPSEFDDFVKGQGDFLTDLYEGKLLSDMSQQDKENIDKPRMQSLEDLLKSLEDDEDEFTENIQPKRADAEMEEEEVDDMLDSLVDDEEEITSDEE